MLKFNFFSSSIFIEIQAAAICDLNYNYTTVKVLVDEKHTDFFFKNPPQYFIGLLYLKFV